MRAITKIGQRRRVPRLSQKKVRQPNGTLQLYAYAKWTYADGSRHDHPYGPWGSPESYVRYAHDLELYEAKGYRMPVKATAEAERPRTVAELVDAFLTHARTHYRKFGKPTGELAVYEAALSRLREGYGRLPIADFGSEKLIELQDALSVTDLETGERIARTTVNHYVRRVKHVFRWGTTPRKYVPSSLYDDLAKVSELEKDRSAARDTDDILPVADGDINTTLPHLSDPLKVMVRFQRSTGARPGEVCVLRQQDIHWAEKHGCYIWTPYRHKTQHRKKVRIIPVSADTYAMLQPFFVGKPADEHVFDYKASSYRRAIHRACDRAGIPPWNPNRIRHTRLTEVVIEQGETAASVVAGHSDMRTIRRYFTPDASLVVKYALAGR